MTSPQPWRISLHGGHSGEYCDHSTGTLREMIEAAVAQGMPVFGVTEHAPRVMDIHRYNREREIGWDVARLEQNFMDYAEETRGLVDEFSDRITILRGFEVEVVPHDTYVDLMLGYRKKHDFEYIVGSVHFMNDRGVDVEQEDHNYLVNHYGGLEQFAVAYYKLVGEMTQALNPEVIGHIDLIRKGAPSLDAVDTPAIRDAAKSTLEIIAAHGAILDINTAGMRKGHGCPYPAPWLLEMARDMDIGVCFGDDSHSPEDVCQGIDTARDYLLAHGISEITFLAREDGGIVKKKASLLS